MASIQLYSPLQVSSQETRLVVLHPSKESGSVVKCELKIVSLNENPDFEALSYVWGDSRETRSIELVGQSFSVTTNLWAALTRLRDKTSPRVIWIDAICINQRDVQEKSSQIPLMGPIYKHARRVVTFLGNSENDYYTHVDALLQLGGDPSCHILEASKRVDPRGAELEIYYKIHDLLYRGWWSRVWTVQEAILAKELVFVYGDRVIPYKFIEDACTHFDAHSRACCSSIFYNEDMRRLGLLLCDSLGSVLSLSEFRRMPVLDSK
jgi:hypothetical protein